MNKKFIGYMGLFVLISSIFFMLYSVSAQYNESLVYSWTSDNSNAIAVRLNIVSTGVVKTNLASPLCCSRVDFLLHRWNSPTGVYIQGEIRNGSNSNQVLDTSTNIVSAMSLVEVSNGQSYVPFYFNRIVPLNMSLLFTVTQYNGTTTDTNYVGARIYSAISSCRYYDGDGTWHDTNWMFCYYVYGANYQSPTPSPTPPVPSGTVAVNLKVNYNGTPTQNYNSYGNITWTVLEGGTPTLNYVVGNNGGGTYYFNNGVNIGLLPQLATGWYFWNYSVTNDEDNISYPIDNFAINLNSTKGTYTITLNIAQTQNTVYLTLVDVTHGVIYFQNYVNSVPSGTRYGEGSYNINLNTVIYVSTIPDSGYVTDYFTVVANNITSQVQGTYLTVICSSNLTITPHYTIFSSGTGATGGFNSFLGFFNSFTWQNIAVLIIYIGITALCTKLFAFTGLIAGIDISTVLCFVTGLLGNLMYPVLGLVVVVNIALIILGSNLLSRKTDGKDA